jgi:hypothetical protein
LAKAPLLAAPPSTAAINTTAITAAINTANIQYWPILLESPWRLLWLMASMPSRRGSVRWFSPGAQQQQMIRFKACCHDWLSWLMPAETSTYLIRPSLDVRNQPTKLHQMTKAAVARCVMRTWSAATSLFDRVMLQTCPRLSLVPGSSHVVVRFSIHNVIKYHCAIRKSIVEELQQLFYRTILDYCGRDWWMGFYKCEIMK